MLFLGVLISIVLPLKAQDMKSIFVNMPDSLSPLFTKVNRADFADFLESNMKSQVKNKFDRLSEMKALTKDYLFLQTTSQSTLEMKLLPLNDSVRVLCMVKTICGSACDSEIRFFTTDWKELLAADYLELPEVGRFFQLTDSTDMEKFAEVQGKADITLLKAGLSQQEDILSFTYATVDYLDKDSANEMKLFLKKEPLIYRWKEGRFIIKD